jgi:hypothetical protein
MYFFAAFQLLVTANVLPSSLILVTLMMVVIHSSKILVLTRATWYNIPEDNTLQNHCHDSLKSYRLSLHFTSLHFTAYPVMLENSMVPIVTFQQVTLLHLAFTARVFLELSSLIVGLVAVAWHSGHHCQPTITYLASLNLLCFLLAINVA